MDCTTDWTFNTQWSKNDQVGEVSKTIKDLNINWQMSQMWYMCKVFKIVPDI